MSQEEIIKKIQELAKMLTATVEKPKAKKTKKEIIKQKIHSKF